MDTLTALQRSERMGRIRGKNTKPELLVRRLAHRLGYRYQLHRKDLPGTPDLVFPARRKVIFVHGCFWHQHANCATWRVPKSKQDFWVPKLNQNVARDLGHQAKLKEIGWDVLVIWECEIKDPGKITQRLREFLGEPGKQASLQQS